MIVPVAYNVRSLFVRKTRTLLTVLGIGAVVAVYIVMTAVSARMKTMFATTGAPDEVIVMQAGALNPEFSQVGRGELTFLASQEQVAVDHGAPVISPELSLASKATLPHGGGVADVMLRGIEPTAVRFYREVQVVEGRPLPSSGAVLVGVQLARAHGLRVGDALELEHGEWTVGGIFTAAGAVYEQEVWIDLDALAAATNRGDVTSFLVRARSPSDAEALVRAVDAQRGEPIQALTSAAAFARIGGMSIWMAALGRFIAIVIALGAIFGGMNTMYAAVAQRSREIGVLRALGYRKGAVLASMLFESVLVGLLGGAVGCALSFLIATVPLNMPFLLDGTVALGPLDLVAGMVLALVVGVIGGILPALQAAAVKIVDALR